MMPNLSSLFGRAFVGLFLVISAPLTAMHHTPGESKPLPVLEKAAVVSFAEGLKKDEALAGFFAAFAEAMRTHDGKPFLPRVADNFTIEGLANADMKAGFVKAMTMITPPEEFIIKSIEPQEGGAKLVKVDFRFPKRTAAREFVLSADHKLISTSLMRMKRVPTGEQTQRH